MKSLGVGPNFEWVLCFVVFVRPIHICLLFQSPLLLLTFTPIFFWVESQYLQHNPNCSCFLYWLTPNSCWWKPHQCALTLIFLRKLKRLLLFQVLPHSQAQRPGRREVLELDGWVCRGTVRNLGFVGQNESDGVLFWPHWISESWSPISVEFPPQHTDCSDFQCLFNWLNLGLSGDYPVSCDAGIVKIRSRL